MPHRCALWPKALARGWSLGTAEPYSLELAELITGRLPRVESIRFVNSGTEAVMSALRVARAATGRAKILQVRGSVGHGHTDSMLLRAGSGLAEAARPDSAGLPPDILQETLVAPLDDADALQALLERHRRGDRRGFIIEPLLAELRFAAASSGPNSCRRLRGSRAPTAHC